MLTTLTPVTFVWTVFLADMTAAVLICSLYTTLFRLFLQRDAYA